MTSAASTTPRTEAHPVATARLPGEPEPHGHATGMRTLVIGALGALLFLARRSLTSAPNWLSIAMWVNLGWGAFNILPVIPFAGGRFLMERLGKTRPSTALLICAATVAASSTLGVVTIRHTGFAVLFLSVSLLSLFELAKVSEQMRTEHIDAQLGAARLLVLNHRYDEAIGVGEEVLARARDFETRNAALTTVAWACLGQGASASPTKLVRAPIRRRSGRMPRLGSFGANRR
jgi:cation transport ATPase